MLELRHGKTELVSCIRRDAFGKVNTTVSGHELSKPRCSDKTQEFILGDQQRRCRSVIYQIDGMTKVTLWMYK
jgi:hypothetical protein